VQRAGHDKLARYFELLDVTEQTALEATRAWYDVQRYRRLVQLAEDSYVQHKYAALQIQSRFKAGVGRGVDLEQANARLALGRIEPQHRNGQPARRDGAIPARDRRAATRADAGVPPLSEDAAGEHRGGDNAAIRRARPSTRASRRCVPRAPTAQVRQSGFHRVSRPACVSAPARIRRGARPEARQLAEIVLNWNLFNGARPGTCAPAAQRRQPGRRPRDKACRDARQLTAIAYNDSRKLNEQLACLDRNTLAIEKRATPTGSSSTSGSAACSTC
jgi:adhesin transport system outer membrane protein